MNPSSRGWIKKLWSELPEHQNFETASLATYYEHLRSCGFIYGCNVAVANTHISSHELTEEERCKVNLLLAFLNIHKHHNTTIPFIDSLLQFYSEINEKKITIFKEFLRGKQDAYTLEKVLHKRIQIDANFFTKNFNYFITNALLYVDVLAYAHFIRSPKTTQLYIINLESVIESVVLKVLNTKEVITSYDESLIKLLEASMRYQDHEFKDYIDISKLEHSPLEARYILDLACMAAWNDQTIDVEEFEFLKRLESDFYLPTETAEQSVASVNTFFSDHKDNISLLSSKNLMQNFYDNSSKMVKTLISRNSKRLIRELKESKELVRLISQSAVRDLSNEEQKKINDQLLDIIKSIPSLAIFILPGGAILLPMFVKLIPKLLPSAFDDNRIEEKK